MAVHECIDKHDPMLMLENATYIPTHLLAIDDRIVVYLAM